MSDILCFACVIKDRSKSHHKNFWGRNQLELNFDIKKFFEVLTNNTQVIDCSFNLFPILAQMVYKIRSDLKWVLTILYISYACRCLYM